MGKYVSVFKHRGFEICTMSPATPEQFGYIIDHAHFADETFHLIEQATSAIDMYLDYEKPFGKAGFVEVDEQKTYTVEVRSIEPKKASREELERFIAMTREDWSNNSCLGYAIAACRDLGMSNDQIQDLVNCMKYAFDMKTLEEARRIYEGSPF